MKPREDGFITFSLLILLPLLLSALAVSASSYLAIRDDSRIRHACRQTLLESQEKVARTLHELLSLNKKAELLRTRRRQLEISLATNPLPHVRAALTAELARVVGQQSALAARQRILVFEGQTFSRRGPREARQQIEALLRDESQIRGSPLKLLNLRFEIKPGEFDLIASPADSPSPSYRPSARFSERQTMSLRASLNASGVLPPWLGGFTHVNGLELRAGCSATLEKGAQNSWDTKLIADKSL